MEQTERVWLDIGPFTRDRFMSASNVVISALRIGIAAVCVADLCLGSAALSQSIKLPPQADSRASTDDLIAGTIFGSDGVTHIVGDGMGGGFIFGPDGLSTFVSNGTGGGTLYAPNTSGSIIADGMGGGILYSTKKPEPSSDQPIAADPSRHP